MTKINNFQNIILDNDMVMTKLSRFLQGLLAVRRNSVYRLAKETNIAIF